MKNFAHPEKKEMLELENLYKTNQIDILILKTENLVKKYTSSSLLFNILGIALQKKRRFEDAIYNFQQAIKNQNDFYFGYNNLGNAYKSLGKFEKAIENYKLAIKINPNYAEAHSNLGIALKEIRNLDDSVFYHNQAIKINPKYADAYTNLGVSLSELGKFEEAIANHQKAITINPNYAEAYSNLGNSLAELGKFEEAIANHQKAIKINPNYTFAKLNEGIIRLRIGEFDIGWKNYEYRLGQIGDNSIPYRYEIDKLWDGNYLDGTLLVWSEQGIGDHILFASMLTDLKKYAKNIVVEIDKRLVNLLKSYFTKIKFLNIKVIGLEKKLYNDFDKHIAIGSLGKYLRKNIKSFAKTPKKYLIPSAEKEKKIKEKFFNTKKLKIGISWKTLNKKQQYRNVELQNLLPILSNPKYDFINLQFGKCNEELSDLKSKHGIEIRTINEIDNYNDIESLACLINCLDLVITIQNSTAHLSGALGKKTWIMLVKNENARWHWTVTEKKSLWYPSLKLYAQEKFKDWSSVINSINSDLKKL